MSKTITVCKIIVGVSVAVIAVSVGISVYRIYSDTSSTQTFQSNGHKETPRYQSLQRFPLT